MVQLACRSTHWNSHDVGNGNLPADGHALAIWGKGLAQRIGFGLLGLVLVGWVVHWILRGTANPWVYLKDIANVLTFLPDFLSSQLALLAAVFFGGTLAAVISYLFGLPVLKMGGDYFGIATLGFTMVVKVLADNADSVFPEMKGARGMIGTPQLASWFWSYFFLNNFNQLMIIFLFKA